MSEVANVGAKAIQPGVNEVVHSIAADVQRANGAALRPEDLTFLNPPLGDRFNAPGSFSAVPLPFQVADLPINTFRPIRDGVFARPIDSIFDPVFTTPASPSPSGNGDILGGASQIDALLAEAQAILSDPNATMEDKLIAQQKMSQAMTLFQFLSSLIKQIADMEQTATRNLS